MSSSSLNAVEVAEILNITKNTVYEMIKRGELPAYKVGRKIRIDKSDIENYINSQKNTRWRNYYFRSRYNFRYIMQNDRKQDE